MEITVHQICWAFPPVCKRMSDFVQHLAIGAQIVDSIAVSVLADMLIEFNKIRSKSKIKSDDETSRLVYDKVAAMCTHRG